MSIVLVLIDHAVLSLIGVDDPRVRSYLSLGDLGVQVFFVISGFLITSILLGPREGSRTRALGLFYFRRAFRILPPALVFLSVVVALQLAGVIVGTGKGEIAAALFFYRNFTGGQYYTDHFWSLSVEEQFYVLWPLIVLQPRTGSLTRTILTMLLVGVAVVSFGSASIPGELRVNVARYCAILTGCLLAVLRARGGILLSSRVCQSPLFFMTLLCALGLSLIEGWSGPGIYLVRSVAMAFLVNFLVSAERRRSIWDAAFNARGVMYVGRISYSLYLWQQIFWGVDPIWFQKMPLGIVLACFAGAASYHGIERPMLRWRERIQDTWKHPESPPGPIGLGDASGAIGVGLVTATADAPG